MIKLAYHPHGQSIKFSSENHLYVDDAKKTYVSATTFVGRFFKAFDMWAQAERSAAGDNPKYAGREPGAIVKEWETIGEKGRSEGTNVHEYAEWVFLGRQGEAPQPLSDRCKKLFRQVDRTHKELTAKYQTVGVEMIVFNPEWGLAGTIDLLMWHPGQGQLIILDWKQNRSISKRNPWQNAFPPIDHLEDSDISHYSLQLSLYKLMILGGGYFPGLDPHDIIMALIHLRENSDIADIIMLEDYGYEVKQMIKAGVQ